MNNIKKQSLTGSINKLSATALVVGIALNSYGVLAESSVTSSSDIKVGNTAGLSLKSGDHYFKIGGRLMFDFAAWDGEAYSGVDGESGSGSEIRRARIYLKGKYKDWQYRFQTDFVGGAAKNKSTYIKYTGLDVFDIHVGKHSEPFGLENLNSSKYISPIERSITGNAHFAGDRELGVSVASNGDNYGYQVGVYDIDSNEVDTNLAITGRFSYAPVNSDDQTLHLGIGVSSRQFSETDSTQIKDRAGVHSTSIKAVDTDSFNAKDSLVYDLEASYTYKRFNVVGEYISADYTGVTAADDRDFSSYYLQTGFFLTDDQRGYDVASGTFSGVKPSATTGAWEVFARFESIDYSDQGLGTDGEIITAGINWFATKLTRLSLNYVTTDLDRVFKDDANVSTVDGQAINIRAQFHF